MTQKTQLSTFYYNFTPILVGVSQKYRIELPAGPSPRPYKTMTTAMTAWDGEVLKTSGGSATALLLGGMEIRGKKVGPLQNGGPCVVMEHINIDGYLEYMVGDKNILSGNINFVNFGIPGGKHLRIDMYTGESKVIDG